MYRRSCGRTAERIDASRRPRIDFLVVKLTGGLRTTQAVHRYCLNLRPSGAECPHTRNPVGHVQGWPVPALSRQEEGQYDPHRVDWMDHLLGSTSSRRGSRGFFLQLKQITDSESLFTALQSLTGTFFSPGSPWRARAVRAPQSPTGDPGTEGVNVNNKNNKDSG